VFREDRGDLWTHSVYVVIVPEVPHFSVYHDYVVETHDNVLHGGFDNAVATVLDETFSEDVNPIHAGMVSLGCKFHHVETTSTQRAGMHGPVAVSRGHNWRSHNRNISSGVGVVAIETEAETKIIITVVTVATQIITATVDSDTTT